MKRISFTISLFFSILTAFAAEISGTLPVIYINIDGGAEVTTKEHSEAAERGQQPHYGRETGAQCRTPKRIVGGAGDCRTDAVQRHGEHRCRPARRPTRHTANGGPLSAGLRHSVWREGEPTGRSADETSHCRGFLQDAGEDGRGVRVQSCRLPTDEPARPANALGL